jgi:hypothetical protein
MTPVENSSLFLKHHTHQKDLWSGCWKLFLCSSEGCGIVLLLRIKGEDIILPIKLRNQESSTPYSLLIKSLGRMSFLYRLSFFFKSWKKCRRGSERSRWRCSQIFSANFHLEMYVKYVYFYIYMFCPLLSCKLTFQV